MNSSPLFEARRLRGPLIVLINLGLILIGLDLTLRFTFGANPSGLTQMMRCNPDEQQRLGQRLSTAESQWVPAASDSSKGLCLITGLSTAREGLDAAWIGPRLDPPCAVLNLGSTGGGYLDLLESMRVIRWTPLRPRIGILAVHPAWLAEEVMNGPDSTDRSNRLRPEERRGFRGRLRVLRHESVWILANRDAIHSGLFQGLSHIRNAFAERMHLSAYVLFPPALDPWRADYLYHSDKGDDAFLQRQWVGFQARGWFDPVRFRQNPRQQQALRAALRQMQEVCEDVYVLWMPERSDFRKAVPLEAQLSFCKTVHSRILDARACIPDDEFYDLAHLNAAGRQRLSQWLTDRLNSPVL